MATKTTKERKADLDKLVKKHDHITKVYENGDVAVYMTESRKQDSGIYVGFTTSCHWTYEIARVSISGPDNNQFVTMSHGSGGINTGNNLKVAEALRALFIEVEKQVQRLTDEIS